MKKLTILIIAPILALSLTACGGSGKSSVSRESPKPPASTKAGDTVQLGGYDWRVLEVRDGKALILSDRVLTVRIYNPGGATWEKSDMRQYLNGAFYNDTFTAKEKAWIAESKIVNNDNPQFNTSGGGQTVDKVFLLSIDEAGHYFADDAARIARDVNTGRARWWWLRSVGGRDDRVAGVYDDGGIDVRGYSISRVNGGVRPALWLNL